MAPPRPLALLCALLVAAFLCSSSASAASDAPFLVAHKKVALTRPKPGLERLAVSLDLYNQGSANGNRLEESLAKGRKDLIRRGRRMRVIRMRYLTHVVAPALAIV